MSNGTCPVCTAPLGPVLYSGGYANAIYDSQTAAWYCGSPCVEKARGSQTISITTWNG